MHKLVRLKFVILALSGLLMSACEGDSGFSLNGEENTFQQSVNRIQVKVDILWVIDNSGSMETSQANLVANFQGFIDKFKATNFDYQMAVTTTDAWRAPVDADPSLARFRDGTDATSHTGVTVIKPDTPNLEDTFITNVEQGINGSGDERGWQSLKEALSMQENLDEPFPRQDALLAVIILTDEDDFSHDGTNNVSGGADPYSNPDLHNPMDYYDFLYTLTNSDSNNTNFVVNTIGIFDDVCLDQLNDVWTGRRKATRYENVTTLSGGYKGSLCEPFADVLEGISDTIFEKSTAFKLSREPAVDTIVVYVDGVQIAEDPVNGWTYNPNNMLLSFHGTSVPQPESVVSITYDPAGLK